MPSRDEGGKRLPGSQQRKAKKERESLKGCDDKAFVQAVTKLGPPPEDPIEAIVWGNRLAAITAWASAVGPLSIKSMARRRGVLEAIKALGMTNSKAVDKKSMSKMAERLGMKQKDANGDLELLPEGAETLRA